jgi:nucleotide-binding universal stress UspA family protein
MLAVINGEEGSLATLSAAFRLARDQDAYLEVLHVASDPNNNIPLIGEGMSGAMVEQVMADLQQATERRAEAAHQVYLDVCADYDLAPVEASSKHPPATFIPAWRKVVGREEQEVARAALLKDLVVVSRPDGADSGSYVPALEAALFDAARPVLVAPPLDISSIGKRVVVAWNGRREAAKALMATVRILAKAESVTLLTLDPESEKTDPQDACDYLAGHGIEAHARQFNSSDSVGVDLLTHAADLQADLLVMGAYGHSRFREFILGGATRSVLHSTALPVILTH